MIWIILLWRPRIHLNPGPPLNGYGLARKCGAYGVPQDFLGRQLPQRQPQQRLNKWPQCRSQRRWQQWPLGLPLPQLLESISESEQPQAQLVTDRRIIIREVDMDLVVEDIQVAIDRIADIAVDAGGWVVDSSRYSLHRGGIGIRVPAELVDSTIDELRRMAREVQTEQTTSRDVTDEYVDLGARLRNEQAAEEALLALLERADSVEAALNVRRDLRTVQGEVERISGRIKFLEETSAFSLIRVTLSLAAVELGVDAGPDQTAAVHTPVRFSATFRRPDGIEDYLITWDFGDGSHPVTVDRTASTREPGQLITATVAHSYDDLKGRRSSRR